MLEVRLIGTFDIKYDGKPVIISSRAAQSLFAYLILTAGTLHRREKLAGMFWPDASEQKARTYLRNELWRIRKVLSPSANVECLLADKLTVGFNQSSAYWLDVAGLKNLSDTASAEELMQALSKYQGELLPGFYENWVVLEREHFQVLVEQKMACLLEILEKEQRWNDILDWAERWISLGQGSETAYKALMIAYDFLGDPVKVVSTYERCVQALRQLALEPSEETRAFAFKRNPKINIPIPLTSFIGREQELKEVAELLSKLRLVTLTGSGGVGKTRLAIQVVADVLERFPDGVWFLDLAPLNDSALVPRVVAKTLGLIEQAGRSPITMLIDFLQTRQALLILDNCEHLIQACAQLAENLLHSCPNLHILATSRESLRIGGELLYRVPSLEVPTLRIESAIDVVEKTESVQLFIERAAVASPIFAINPQKAPVVAQICQRLDGIPLAIELAAARINILTVEQILQRLDDRFNLLTSGSRTALPRHQTLGATIEWSYKLLSNKERTLLQCLSVFVGGWTLEAAEAVYEDGNVLDLLGRLVEKSLVAVDREYGNEARYHFLEAIRHYALEKLRESENEGRVRALHLDFFVKFAEEAGSKLRGPEQLECLNRLEREYSNLRAALEQSKESGNVDVGLRIAWSLLLFWSARGYWRDAKVLLVDILARPGAMGKTPLRVKGLIVAGLVATLSNDIPLAHSWLDEGILIARDLGPDSKSLLAISLGLKGYSIIGSDLSLSRSLCEEALVIGRETDDKYVIANVLDYLGNIYAAQGDYVTARAASNESVTIFVETKNRWMSSRPLANLGWICYQQGEYDAARSYFEAGLEIYREIGDKANIAFTLATLADIDRIQGDYSTSIALYEESLAIRQTTGDEFSISPLLVNLGQIRLQQGDISQAMALFEESFALSKKIGNKTQMSICLSGFVALAMTKRQPKLAAQLVGTLDASLESISAKLEPVYRIDHMRNTAAVRAQLDEEIFTAAWVAGQKLSLNEAASYALKRLR